MPHNSRRLARFIAQLEGRVTDLEQGRPADAPETRVENVTDEDVTASDSVSETQLNNPTASYNSSDDYNASEYA